MNIFATIGKNLALAKLQKELPKAMKQAENDPDMAAAVSGMMFYSKEVAKLLPYYCKRRPESAMCKDYKGTLK